MSIYVWCQHLNLKQHEILYHFKTHICNQFDFHHFIFVAGITLQWGRLEILRFGSEEGLTILWTLTLVLMALFECESIKTLFITPKNCEHVWHILAQNSDLFTYKNIIFTYKKYKENHNQIDSQRVPQSLTKITLKNYNTWFVLKVKYLCIYNHLDRKCQSQHFPNMAEVLSAYSQIYS